MGAAIVVRDPLYSLPLTGNSRYGALAALAEQQLQALQLAMSTTSGSGSEPQ